MIGAQVHPHAKGFAGGSTQIQGDLGAEAAGLVGGFGSLAANFGSIKKLIRSQDGTEKFLTERNPLKVVTKVFLVFGGKAHRFGILASESIDHLEDFAFFGDIPFLVGSGSTPFKGGVVVAYQTLQPFETNPHRHTVTAGIQAIPMKNPAAFAQVQGVIQGQFRGGGQDFEITLITANDGPIGHQGVMHLASR